MGDRLVRLEADQVALAKQRVHHGPGGVREQIHALQMRSQHASAIALIEARLERRRLLRIEHRQQRLRPDEQASHVVHGGDVHADRVPRQRAAFAERVVLAQPVSLAKAGGATDTGHRNNLRRQARAERRRHPHIDFAGDDVIQAVEIVAGLENDRPGAEAHVQEMRLDRHQHVMRQSACQRKIVETFERNRLAHRSASTKAAASSGISSS